MGTGYSVHNSQENLLLALGVLLKSGGMYVARVHMATVVTKNV